MMVLIRSLGYRRSHYHRYQKHINIHPLRLPLRHPLPLVPDQIFVLALVPGLALIPGDLPEWSHCAKYPSVT